MSWVAATVLASSSAAQNVTNPAPVQKPYVVPAALYPPPSPIDYFRSLLAMSLPQREKALANKSPEVRARILAKVDEYEALDPTRRELRLRATELRLFLMPVLRAAPQDRAAMLAQVPDDVRDLVHARLMQWEILPPRLQQEFLKNANILAYFSGVAITNANGRAGFATPSAAEQSYWSILPPTRKEAMIAQFEQFVDLSPLEKQKALGDLPDPERAQVEKTLETFDKLGPAQQNECIHAFGKFATMSAGERAEFLKNAQLWSQMSAADRKAWCDLVEHVPQWPPLPQAALMPPMPPRAVLPKPVPSANTNRS